MGEPPVEVTRTLLQFTDGTVAYAGRYLHEDTHAVHTHSFVEVTVMISGEGVHHSLAGRQRLEVGDVLLLRPGAWHGYQDCRRLEMYNCCFSTQLLQRELGWTREDPFLGYLLWTGPYAAQRRGILAARLGPAELAEGVAHLDALAHLGFRPADSHRGDIIGRLALFLSGLARAVAPDGTDGALPVRAHPAVMDAMRLMEARPGYAWTLTEIAECLHLAPGYLVRLFKSATGLPPMAFLTRHRVEIAAARLLETDEPIARIGESVGWPDQNYFARRFKAHFGLSASAYRAQFVHRPLPRPVSPAAATADR
jgi:AraC family L-rhamnose operon transcriptional activator RhaR